MEGRRSEAPADNWKRLALRVSLRPQRFCPHVHGDADLNTHSKPRPSISWPDVTALLLRWWIGCGRPWEQGLEACPRPRELIKHEAGGPGTRTLISFIKIHPEKNGLEKNVLAYVVFSERPTVDGRRWCLTGFYLSAQTFRICYINTHKYIKVHAWRPSGESAAPNTWFMGREQTLRQPLTKDSIQSVLNLD